MKTLQIELCDAAVHRPDDKKAAHLNVIAQRPVADSVEDAAVRGVTLPDRSIKGAYDNQRSLRDKRFVCDKY